MNTTTFAGGIGQKSFDEHVERFQQHLRAAG
jgi:hypothetical protein